jgi:hypothetical protein
VTVSWRVRRMGTVVRIHLEAARPVRRHDPDRMAAAADVPLTCHVTGSRMRRSRSRSALEWFVDPITSRGVGALNEGLVMHTALSTAPGSREQTRAVRPIDEQDPL